MSFYKENRNCPGISILHWTDKQSDKHPDVDKQSMYIKMRYPTLILISPTHLNQNLFSDLFSILT